MEHDQLAKYVFKVLVSRTVLHASLLFAREATRYRNLS